MSALTNYIKATTDAGFVHDENDTPHLVVQTPTKFYLIVDDLSGEFECALVVFSGDDYWQGAVPGTMAQCLECLSKQDTLV